MREEEAVGGHARSVTRDGWLVEGPGLQVKVYITIDQGS